MVFVSHITFFLFEMSKCHVDLKLAVQRYLLVNISEYTGKEEVKLNDNFYRLKFSAISECTRKLN